MKVYGKYYKLFNYMAVFYEEGLIELFQGWISKLIH